MNRQTEAPETETQFWSVDDHRKISEAAQRQLADIVDASDDAILSKNLDGIITSWNPGAEKMFGYSAGEAIGRPALMLFPPECAQEQPEIMSRIMRGEVVKYFETVRVGKGGRRVEVSVNYSPLINQDGGVTGVSIIARDITSRRETEKSLLEMKQRLEAIVEYLPAGLVVADNDGRRMHFNAAAKKMYGFATREAALLPLEEFIRVFELSTLAGAVLPSEQWPLRRVLRGEILSGLELRVRRLSGDWKRVFSYSGSMVRYGEGRQVAFLVVRDVTEEK